MLVRRVAECGYCCVKCGGSKDPSEQRPEEEAKVLGQRNRKCKGPEAGGGVLRPCKEQPRSKWLELSEGQTEM